MASFTTLGRTAFRYINLACGMPLVRHCETACALVSHSAAQALVPPSRSIKMLVVFESMDGLKHTENKVVKLLQTIF